MPAYNGLSGGAGAANALGDILDQRRELERRAQLDELARRQSEANIANQTESTKSLSQHRNLQNEKAILDMFGSGHRPSDDVTNTDPGVMGILKKYNRVKTDRPTVSTGGAIQDAEGNWGPDPNDQTTTEGPERTVYTGDSDAQEKLEQQLKFRELANDQSLNPDQRAAMKVAGTTGNMQSIPAGWYKEEASDQPIYSFDAATGKVTKSDQTFKGNSPHFFTQTRPPREPHDPLSAWHDAGVSKKGTKLIMNGYGQIKDTNMDMRASAGSSGGKNGDFQITPAENNSVRSSRTALSKIRESAGLWQRMFGGGAEADPNYIAGKQGLDSSLNVIVGKLPTMRAQQAAFDVLSEFDANPAKFQGVDVASILRKINEAAVANDGEALTDAEAATLFEAIPILLGQR